MKTYKIVQYKNQAVVQEKKLGNYKDAVDACLDAISYITANDMNILEFNMHEDNVHLPLAVVLNMVEATPSIAKMRQAIDKVKAKRLSTM